MPTVSQELRKLGRAVDEHLDVATLESVAAPFEPRRLHGDLPDDGLKEHTRKRVSLGADMQLRMAQDPNANLMGQVLRAGSALTHPSEQDALARIQALRGRLAPPAPVEGALSTNEREEVALLALHAGEMRHRGFRPANAPGTKFFGANADGTKDDRFDLDYLLLHYKPGGSTKLVESVWRILDSAKSSTHFMWVRETAAASGVVFGAFAGIPGVLHGDVQWLVGSAAIDPDGAPG